MVQSSTELPVGEPRQKYLGAKGLVALITLLSAFVPLSTDLYLPALPSMGMHLNASDPLINLTLVLFFIFYSLGTLIWGPLSDKYGRRPILVVGLVGYTAASILCACAWNVYALIAFRILQAVSGSAASAVATAIVKEVYHGRKRESVLALVQSMVLISPAVAPMLGALLLQITSWQGVFWTLAGIGLISLIGSLLYEETITVRYTGNVGQSMGRLVKVLNNRNFFILMMIFSVGSVASMAYISSSTYIYQDGFGLSGQVYSYYFALNALAMMSGPVIYLQLSKHVRRSRIISVCFAIQTVMGVLLAAFGSLAPWLFALLFLPISACSSCLRPPGVNLMLDQQKEDAGSASSLIGCFGTLMGSLGMLLISFDWGNTIIALGVINLLVGGACFFFWPVVTRMVKVTDLLPGTLEQPVSLQED